MHHHAQSEGRQEIFDDYRLRIAYVAQTVAPSQDDLSSPVCSTYRDPAAGFVRIMVVAQGCGELPAECASPSDAFESLNRDGERLWLFNAADGAEALALACDLRTGGLTARVCEVERDYGMFDRTEAPQYHPPVSRFACPVSGETIGRKAIAS